MKRKKKPHPKPVKFENLCLEVANEINASFNTLGGVTTEQVHNVAKGNEPCESHPVIAGIRSELRVRGIDFPLPKRIL